MYALDLQRERARADALAMRLYENQPLEKSGSPIRLSTESALAPNTQIEPIAEPPAVPPMAEMPNRVKPILEYQGTQRTRQLVARLQSALATGTPLQDYQVQPLIDAIDQVRGESSSQGMQNAAPNGDANRRIIQATADILFESQLDALMDLLEADRDAEKAK